MPLSLPRPLLEVRGRRRSLPIKKAGRGRGNGRGGWKTKGRAEKLFFFVSFFFPPSAFFQRGGGGEGDIALEKRYDEQSFEAAKQSSHTSTSRKKAVIKNWRKSGGGWRPYSVSSLVARLPPRDVFLLFFPSLLNRSSASFPENIAKKKEGENLGRETESGGVGRGAFTLMESPSPPLLPFIRILLFWWGNEEIGVEWKEEGGEELPFEFFSLPSFV